jgi:hypothetical protein
MIRTILAAVGGFVLLFLLAVFIGGFALDFCYHSSFCG